MNTITSYVNQPYITIDIQNGEASRHIWLLIEGRDRQKAQQIIQESISKLSSEEPPESWPAKIGQLIDKQLRSLSESEKCIALFAAASITADAVHVATVGDIRVHLIRKNEVIHVSTDQTLANDLDKAHVREQMEDPQMAHNIVTGNLGSKEPARIDTFNRRLERPFKLLTCSNEIHRGRAVKDYFNELLTEQSSVASKYSGLLAILDMD